jgi:secondary thiamine-phosphate synthase enzyme
MNGNYKVSSHKLQFSTKGDEIDLIDITTELENFVSKESVVEGNLLVFAVGSTGAILTTEAEDGLLEDTKKTINNLIPKGMNYKHDLIDNNAHSHLRASIFGSSLTIPIIKKNLTLGTWQQIFYADFDVRPRSRTVVVQVSGI